MTDILNILKNHDHDDKSESLRMTDEEMKNLEFEDTSIGKIVMEAKIKMLLEQSQISRDAFLGLLIDQKF